MKKIIIIIAVVLAVAGIVLLIFRKGDNEPKFKTVKPVRGQIIDIVSATGIVNPVDTVNIGSQVSGTIKKLYVDYNSKVKAGQLIALIDPALFEAQRNQATANLQMAEAEVEKSQANLVVAERNLVRVKSLFEKHFMSASDLDIALGTEQESRAQLGVSKAKVAQSRAAVSLAETNLHYTRIVSPVDGIVISRSVSEGQTVAASFQTPTLFVIAVDLTNMQIDTNIAEADIGDIKDRMDAEFRVDAYPDTVFKGVVIQVRNAAVTVQNVVTYDVVIGVDNEDLLLKPGMTANVSVLVQKKNDVLKVPNAALRFVPAGAEKAKEPSVWVLENGAPKRVTIKKGISDDDDTEVESAGLSVNSDLILEALGKTAKKPGMPPPMMR